jgi:hypothetical protein
MDHRKSVEVRFVKNLKGSIRFENWTCKTGFEFVV